MEFEDNKINGHVPAQIVLNPDGTTSGATVPDVRTAGEKVHATIGTVRAMSRTMLFARDIHHGDRASLIRVSKGMATPNDGDMIPATTHPEVVKGILRGDQATCSDTEWLNDPYKRGMWSRGTAYLDDQGKPQGWVRMPDLNQAKEGSLPPPFARGGADAKAGSIGKDTMRRIEASFNNIPTSVNIRSGAFDTEINADSVDIAGAAAGHKSVKLKFDSSKGLPEGHTGTEFAPWHIYGVSYSITSNGVMNEGAIDAEQVMGEVLLDRARVDVTAQFGVTLNATLTGSDNNIAAENLAARLGLEKGDVIRIVAGAHTKLHTVESLTNANNLAVNWEHCAARGNGPLKLPDYTGPVTIKRIAKWFNAPLGLGQERVDLTALRAVGVPHPNTSGRTVKTIVIDTGGASTSGVSLVMTVDGDIVSSHSDGGSENRSRNGTVSYDVKNGAQVSVTSSRAVLKWWEIR